MCNNVKRSRLKKSLANTSPTLQSINDEESIAQCFQFANEKDLNHQSIVRYRERELNFTMKSVEQILRINRLNEEIILIEEKPELEIQKEEVMRQLSEVQTKSFRYFLNLKYWRLKLVEASDKIIKSKIFDKIVIIVIIMNSIYLAIDDYNMESSSSEKIQKIRSTIENIFNCLYLIEFLLKVSGMGFIINKNSYMRNYWNIIDFVIIMQVLITWAFSDLISFKLNSLRVVRVLRPLKSLKSIEGLRILVISILHSLPLLRDTFIILTFFYLIFALVGLHMFAGNFKNRCIYEINGTIGKNGQEMLCASTEDCPPSFYCGRAYIMNPNNDQTSFDNFFISFLTVFQCVTLEGWTQVMTLTMLTTHKSSALYFVFMIFIGSFFMVNLTLAVINNKVTEAHQHFEEQTKFLEWQKKHVHKGLTFEQQKDKNSEDLIGKEEQLEEESEEANTIHDTITGESEKKNKQQNGLTIRQFIVGKQTAATMIKFLRSRQQQKRLQDMARKSVKRQTMAKALLEKIILRQDKSTVPIQNYFSSSSSKNDEMSKVDLFKERSHNSMMLGRPSIFGISNIQNQIVEEESKQESESYDINASHISSSQSKSNSPQSSHMTHTEPSKEDFNVAQVTSRPQLLPDVSITINHEIYQEQEKNDSNSNSFIFPIGNLHNEQMVTINDRVEVEEMIFDHFYSPKDEDNLNSISNKQIFILENQSRDSNSINSQRKNLKSQEFGEIEHQIMNNKKRMTVANQKLQQESLIETNNSRDAASDVQRNSFLLKRLMTSPAWHKTRAYQRSKFILPPNLDSPYVREEKSAFRIPIPKSPVLNPYERASTLLQSPNHRMSLVSNQMIGLNLLRMKAMVNQHKETEHRRQHMLNQIIDQKTQKVVIKPFQEYFSSSCVDVFENRLINISKTEDQSLNHLKKSQLLKNVRPYKLRVKYQISKQFKNQFQDMKYRVFQRMMQEDEELRRLHMEQPYESTTSTLFNQFGLNFQNIKNITTRSDLIVSSTLSLSLSLKEVPLRYFEINRKESHSQEQKILEDVEDFESLVISDDEYQDNSMNILMQPQQTGKKQQLYFTHGHKELQDQRQKIQIPGFSSNFSNTLRDGLQQFFASTGNLIKEAISTNTMRENNIEQLESFPADLMQTKQSREGDNNEIEMLEGSIVEPYHDSFFEKSNKQLEEVPADQLQMRKDLYENPLEEQNNYVRYNSGRDDEGGPIVHLRSETVTKLLLNSPSQNREINMNNRVDRQSENLKIIQNNLDNKKLRSPFILSSLVNRDQLSANNLLNPKQKLFMKKAIQKHSSTRQIEQEQQSPQRIYRQRTMQKKTLKLKQMNQKQAQQYFFDGHFYSSDEGKNKANLIKSKEKVSEDPTNMLIFGKRIRNSIINNQLDLLSVRSNIQKINQNQSSLSTLSPTRRSRNSQYFDINERQNANNRTSILKEQKHDPQAGDNVEGFSWMKHKKQKLFQEDQFDYYKFLDKLLEAKESKYHYKPEQDNSDQESCLSDLIPSSLESEYEEVKYEIRKRIVRQNRSSQSLGMIMCDVSEDFHRNTFDFQILKKLNKNKVRTTNRWSGTDVLKYSLTNLEKANYITETLGNIRVWPKKGPSFLVSSKACFYRFSATVKQYISSHLFEAFMHIIVLLNTGVLAFDVNNDISDIDLLSIFNFIFTGFFALEMILKFIAYGFNRYFKDPLNSIDCIIVAMSLIEFITTFGIENKNQKHGNLELKYSIFRTIKIFRVLRFLRMARLLRQLESMQIMIAVIRRSILQFLHIALLLLLFLFTYALLGMQIFGKIAQEIGEESPLSRVDFSDFNKSFVNLFIVLTITNWHQTMYDTMYFSENFRVAAALYFVSFIIIGNYIFLNLFLAVLIDSFLKEGENSEHCKLQEEQEKDESKQIHQILEVKKPNKHHKKLLRGGGQQTSSLFIKRETISNPIAKTIVMKIKDDTETQNVITTSADLIGMVKVRGEILLREIIDSKIEGLKLEDVKGLGEQRLVAEFIEQQMVSDQDFLSTRDLIALAHGNLRIQLNENQKFTSKLLYNRVKCEESLFIFSKQNLIRSFLIKLLHNKYFEQFILFIIIISSAKLAVETYYLDDPQDSIEYYILNNLDYVLTGIFTIESLIKMIAFGVIFDKMSYLRHVDNIMDLFIVISSLIDIVFQSHKDSMSHLKIFRLLRTLRPIRLITHSHSMQVLVTTLFQSLSGIFNVLILIIIVWFMFAILGVSLYSKQLIYCSLDPKSPYKYYYHDDCYDKGGVWMSYPLNFDTVPEGMLTLLVISSLNNWDQLMYQAIDSTGADSGPVMYTTPAAAYFYLTFILVCSFFLMNFLIGILFLNFKEVQKTSSARSLNNSVDEELEATVSGDIQLKKYTKEEEEVRACWRDIQRMIVNAEIPNEDVRLYQSNTKKGKISWHERLRAELRKKVAPGRLIDNMFTLCIILNVIGLALYHADASQQFTDAFYVLNLTFTVLYAIEALIKIYANGMAKLNKFISIPRYFILTHWNKFDFLLVLAGFFEAIMDDALTAVSKDNLSFKQLPQVVRILRVMRVSRIFRLVEKYEGLKALISTLIFSLPPIFSVFALLFVLLFIFAILGVYLFRDVISGEIIDIESGGFMGFSNFGVAMLMLLRLTTGEDWSNVYTDTIDPKNCSYSNPTCVSKISSLLYFVGFNILCSYLVLNLFVLIALEQFDRYYLPKDNVMARFRKDLEEFKEAWAMHSSQNNEGVSRLREIRIPKFIRSIKQPLGFYGMNEDAETNMMIDREIIKMSIYIDSERCVHFHELLYRVMRRLYGNHHLLISGIDMQIYELITQKKVQEYTEATMKKIQSSSEDYLVPKFAGIANPLMALFSTKQALKAWARLARSHSNLRGQQNACEVSFEVEEEILISSDEEQSSGSSSSQQFPEHESISEIREEEKSLSGDSVLNQQQQQQQFPTLYYFNSQQISSSSLSEVSAEDTSPKKPNMIIEDY